MMPDLEHSFLGHLHLWDPVQNDNIHFDPCSKSRKKNDIKNDSVVDHWSTNQELMIRFLV